LRKRIWFAWLGKKTIVFEVQTRKSSVIELHFYDNQRRTGKRNERRRRNKKRHWIDSQPKGFST